MTLVGKQPHSWKLLQASQTYGHPKPTYVTPAAPEVASVFSLFLLGCGAVNSAVLRSFEILHDLVVTTRYVTFLKFALRGLREPHAPANLGPCNPKIPKEGPNMSGRNFLKNRYGSKRHQFLNAKGGFVLNDLFHINLEASTPGISNALSGQGVS